MSKVECDDGLRFLRLIEHCVQARSIKYSYLRGSRQIAADEFCFLTRNRSVDQRFEQRSIHVRFSNLQAKLEGAMNVRGIGPIEDRTRLMRIRAGELDELCRSLS